MKTFIREHELQFIQVQNFKKEPDFDIYHGQVLDSYWWEVSKDERQDVVSIYGPEDFILVDPLGPHNYVPVEYALQICRYEIENSGVFLSVTDSARSNWAFPPTCESASKLFDRLIAGQEQIDFEPVKNKGAALKNACAWYLNDLMINQGSSDFITHAKTVLKTGKRDFKTLAYIVNKVLDESQARSNYSLPKKPLEMEPQKKTEIKGNWQVRKIKEQHGFYGQKNWVVCSNDQGRGVCFNLSREKLIDLNLFEGDFVGIKAGVKDIHKNKKYLVLERVELTLK